MMCLEMRALQLVGLASPMSENSSPCLLTRGGLANGRSVVFVGRELDQIHSKLGNPELVPELQETLEEYELLVVDLDDETLVQFGY